MVCEMDGIVYLLSPAINRDEQEGWTIQMEALRRTEAGWVSLKKSLDAFTHVLVPDKLVAQSFVFRPLQVDSSFGKTTIESINQATQLYVLVARLLGPGKSTRR
jgi:hypothetical protein